MAPAFKLPRSDQRISIMGHTGSGKTHAANWILSHSTFYARPWVIIDYKIDPFFEDVPGLTEFKAGAAFPRKKGLHITHPRPDENDAVEALLWSVWERGNTGVYIDEAHMLPDRGGLRACLTQGRAKRIPMIVITQRPSWVSRFVFSEADFYCVFFLNDRDDRNTIGRFMPKPSRDAIELLPPRHSLWHQVADNATFHLPQLPNRDSILSRFEARRPEGFWADLARPAGKKPWGVL